MQDLAGHKYDPTSAKGVNMTHLSNIPVQGNYMAKSLQNQVDHALINDGKYVALGV